ncbi:MULTISPECIES: hypothetical protein [Corynebacterium]|uniref:Secreted protein n=1 Tax=Corynebacterium lipophilum TaxID=2804918 RepID=A0AAW5HVW7_9CORY|nr:MULTISPECIES: hypothetical protein [Corynebacterium]MCO6394334.1 hypothetical protein [Corynebacterium lipophilum]MCZ2116944.1 hypothetical protein [Corynebacterium lipophilum]OIR42010.1 hypothetical protein BJP06_09405 [Corynebacterium sp. NML120713]
MTNPYQSNESHPGTDEWAAQQPQQQYQQPYYQQPYQPQPPYQQQQKSSTGLVVALSVLGTLLLLGIAGAVAFLFVRSDGSNGEQQDPVIVTEVETVTPESQNNQGSKPNVNRREPMGSSAGFSNATAETGNTSSEFAGNVLAVFNERAAATGEFPGSLSVYSPVTGQTYTMSCWPAGGGARCQGGNNASVYLY